MQIYCINLTSRPDRWANMLAQAARCGVEISRVEAIDGRSPMAEPILADIPSRGPLGHLGRGTRACTASHMAAWRMFLDSGDDHALFLEDDVVLSRDLPVFLSELESAPLSFDVLRLEGKADPTRRRLFGPVSAVVAGRNIRRCHQLAVDTAGYVLSRRAARRALARAGGSGLPVDHFISCPLRRGHGVLGLPVLQAEPSLAYQDKTIASDIEPMRGDRRGLVERLPRWWYELVLLGSVARGLLGGARFRTYAFCDRMNAPAPRD